MKKIHYIFRLRSSRGTDICHCLQINASLGKKDIRYEMERYAEKITQGTACREYSVTYRRVNMVGRRELFKKYDVACKSQQNIRERCQALAAMLNLRKLS